MHFSAQEEYGLRCAMQLARHYGEQAVTAREISEWELISLDYVQKLLSQMRHKGLVESIRGIRGGFRLLRAPEDISVWEVLRMLSRGANAEGHCARFDTDLNPCPRGRDCEMRLFWDLVLEFCETFGSRISLRNLIDRKMPRVKAVFVDQTGENGDRVGFEGS